MIPGLLTPDTVFNLLKAEEPSEIDLLFKTADTVRQKNVGDEVHLRGLIEISNHCVRQCAYCGINQSNSGIKRYRMNEDEIINTAMFASRLGCGTVVLQSGEDRGVTTDMVTSIIRKIKEKAVLAITLSLGERSMDELSAWKQAGADRYLLRFETSDLSLYNRIHPALNQNTSNRLGTLKKLKETGYEAGGGIMVGIPGQTFNSVVNDIMLFKELDLDMVGIGPYIPHPGTMLGKSPTDYSAPVTEQVPSTEIMCLKVLAVTRVMCPDINIPGTTAIETINPEEGRKNALQCGANVLMPNLTPVEYKKLYEIYPLKAGSLISPEEAFDRMKNLIISINRIPGRGKGGRNTFSHNPGRGKLK